MVPRSLCIIVSASARARVPVLARTLIILASFLISLLFTVKRNFHLKKTKIAFFKKLLNPPMFHLYQQV